MNTSKRFAIALLCLCLLLAGCSNGTKNSKDERKISKITTTEVAHMLVEDAANGQVISDDTKTNGVEEFTFIWDGDLLKQFLCYFNNQLYCSYVYSYTDGKLAEIIDETDGQEMHFYYSNDLLVKHTRTEGPGVINIQDFSYDEQGRIKSEIITASDGSYIFQPGIFPETGEGVVRAEYAFEYSENQISQLSCKYFSPADSENPMRESAMAITSSSVINPLKGIFTPNFDLLPWNYFSDNFTDGIKYYVNGKPGRETNYEVTDDKGYPVKAISTVHHTKISDGKRTTIDVQSIAEYEYLD